MKSIFDFRDYREFLTIRFKELKSENKGFTYRYIGSQIGIKSAGQITSILNGKANLSKRTLPLMADLLNLKGRARKYFLLLVAYNQSTDMVERRHLLKKLAGFSNSKAISLNKNQYLFYQKWYYAAIRDLLAIEPFRGDYKTLAQSLTPAITPGEARKGISLLEELELIHRDEHGVFRTTSDILNVEIPDETSVVLSGYADEMIQQARHALNNRPREERTIVWAGFSVSKECYAAIQDEIRAFRNHILDIVEKDSNPEQVFQLNIQSFPLSKDFSKEK